MRIINLENLEELVYKSLIDINFHAPSAFTELLKEYKEKETKPLAKSVLEQIIENHSIASKNSMPLCQDTGIVVVFLEIGNKVTYDGDIYESINNGVRKAYKDAFLRKSIVKHPFDRVNTNDNTPAIIHTKIIQGDQIKLKIASKGGGSENMSLVKMLTPAEGIEGVKKLVLDTIFYAGGKPCPPIVLGIGIGGNLEKSAMIAKEALFRDFEKPSSNPTTKLLEEEILELVNKTGIGPMGLGGDLTCLGVNIETAPCHIASLPVAINIQCHIGRHIEVIL